MRRRPMACHWEPWTTTPASGPPATCSSPTRRPGTTSPTACRSIRKADPATKNRPQAKGPVRRGLSKIGFLVQRPDFDFTGPGHGVGAALYPLHGFVHIPDLPQPEPGHQLAGFGERAVGDMAGRSIERHALAPRRRLQAVGRQQPPRLPELLVAFAHGPRRVGRRHLARFAFPGGFYQYHDSHLYLLDRARAGPALLLPRRTNPAENDVSPRKPVEIGENPGQILWFAIISLVIPCTSCEHKHGSHYPASSGVAELAASRPSRDKRAYCPQRREYRPGSYRFPGPVPRTSRDVLRSIAGPKIRLGPAHAACGRCGRHGARAHRPRRVIHGKRRTDRT